MFKLFFVYINNSNNKAAQNVNLRLKMQRINDKKKLSKIKKKQNDKSKF